MSTARLDVAALMLSRLATMYQGKPIMEALLGAIAAELQEVEDAFQQLLDLRDVDAAVGAQLAGLEALVGQTQFAFTDVAVRRAWVKARVLLNRSSGRPEDLLAIFAAVLDTPLTAELTERFPAALDLRVVGGALTADLAAALGRMLQLGKAGGVKATLLWQPDVDAEMFTLPAIVITLAEELFGGELNFDATVWTGTPPEGSEPSFSTLVTSFTIGNAGNLEVFAGYDGYSPGSPGNFSIDGFGTIVNPHSIGEQITIYGTADPGKGFDDASAPGGGGKLAGAI